MFALDGKLKFINIDEEYMKSLNTACSEVYYRPKGYDNKPYMGILVNEGDRSYVIPLSSAKPKHKSWKNVNQECYLVYEYALKSKLGNTDIWVEEQDSDLVKHIIAAIDIKKMIPIKEGLYTIVDLNKNASDTPEIEKYKDLLNKEYSFCLNIIEDLIKKANKLYDHQIKTGKIKKFCCDFNALENVCDTYKVK